MLPAATLAPQVVAAAFGPGVARLVAEKLLRRAEVVDARPRRPAARINDGETDVGRLDGTGEEPAGVARAEVHVFAPTGPGQFVGLVRRPRQPAEAHGNDAQPVRLGEHAA